MTVTNIPGSQDLYQQLSKAQTELKAMYRSMSDTIGQLLLGYGEIIAPTSLPQIQAEVGRIVLRYFVSPTDNRSAFANDGVTAVSPYAQILNRRLATVQAKVVLRHARFIKANLNKTLFRWLTPPNRPVAETFEYDPPHTWVDPNGYTLSQRIWQTGEKTRMRMDAYLTEQIRMGRSTREIAAGAERFLLPGRAPLRTTRPYGRDASFDGMRLARTEIGRAHSAATFEASLSNPLVTGIDWALSARHPKIDICDSLATIGKSGERLRAPHPKESAPVCVADSHPQCICNNRPAVEFKAEAIAQLQALYDQGRNPPRTPADFWVFLSTLMASSLFIDIDKDVREDIDTFIYAEYAA